MSIFAIALLVFAFAFFLFALAALIYVAYRFLSLAISMDSYILKELQSRPASIPPADPTSINDSMLRRFMASQEKPTEGDFVFNTDEELAIAEEVRKLKTDMSSMSEEDEKELSAQIRQGGVTPKG